VESSSSTPFALFSSTSPLSAVAEQTSSPESKSKDRCHLQISKVNLWLIFLFVATFILRLWGISHMHYWDENVYLQNAEFIFSGKHNYNEIDSRPPLISVLFAAAFWFWHSDYAAWIVTALLNALGPVFLYLAGRRIMSREASILAALLLAFVPFLAGVIPDPSSGFVSDATGHSLMTDCPALTLIILSFWLLLRAQQKESPVQFAWAGFALAMAVLMRFGSLSSVGILFLVPLASSRRLRALVACGMGFVIGILPYLYWSRLNYGGLFYTFINGWYNFAGPSESPFYYLVYSHFVFSWLAIFGVAALLYHRLRDACIPSSGPVSWPDCHTPPSERRWELFLWLWVVAAMVSFSSLSHKEPRYVIPAAGPLLLLAGSGLAWLLGWSFQRGKVARATILLIILTWTFWPDHHRFDTAFVDHAVSEEMQVSDFLTHAVPASSVLYTNMNYPDYAYYTSLSVIPLPEGGAELYSQLNQIAPGSIVIAYERDDDNKTMEPSLGWLDSNPRFQRLRKFSRLVLFKRNTVVLP
jgi:4-amino-4-deoxy-L-arabinose transferase-like glycosyltransferase